MNTRARWVKPALSERQKAADIPLQTSDLIPNWMDFVWVLPGPLEEGKLCDAIALTLRDYHYAVGRVNFDETSGQWVLSFDDNPGIPVTFGSTTRPSVMSDEFDHERHPDYVDQHPFVLDRGPDASSLERALVTLKVVEGNGETTLTLGWCHILGSPSSLAVDARHAVLDMTYIGDCASMAHWANSLSLYYQGIQPSFTPTFEKYCEPDPTVEESAISDILPLLYHQEHALQNSNLLALFSNMFSTTSRISVRISALEVHAIHTWVSCGATGVPRISEADAVVGFLSACIASVSPVCVERIAYILGTRGIHPALPSTTMGNCMQTITTERVDAGTAPWDFADALRKSMNFVRDPEIMRRILGLHCQMLRRPGLTPDYVNIHSPDTVVYINALHKIPVLNVDFGFPGRVQFYLYGSAEHFLSMLPANPTLEADGTWTSDVGGIEVVFRLKHDRIDGLWRKYHELMETANAMKMPDADLV